MCRTKRKNTRTDCIGECVVQFRSTVFSAAEEFREEGRKSAGFGHIENVERHFCGVRKWKPAVDKV